MIPATTSSACADTATLSTTEHLTHAWRSPQDTGQLAAPLTLRDGATVHTRAICADDTQRLRAFHARLSLETVYRRYFTPMPELPLPIAEQMAHVDYENRMALVATVGTGDDERIVAIVSYERAGPSIAEVAFVVEDGWQGRGIATGLLYRLADYARERGIYELMAQTMGWNAQMHALLRHSGFPAVSYRANGLTVAALDISQPPEPTSAK